LHRQREREGGEETQTAMKPSNCVAGRILAKRNVSLEMGLEQALQEAREDFAYSAFHGLGAVAIAVPLSMCVCVSLSLSVYSSENTRASSALFAT
jgi:hypothetical protein